MTLLELKTQIALYCGKATVADLTVDGLDLGLMAINQVRQQAEMEHDFEFSRKLLVASVSSLTGGSLNGATVFGGEQEFEVKTIVDVGLFDSNNNLRPIDWRTVANSLELQRQDNRYGQMLYRYPTDAECEPWGVRGSARVTFSGDDIHIWPKTALEVTPTTYQVGIEAYCFSPEYTSTQAAVACVVTGTSSPDASGIYALGGMFQGQPYYVRDDEAFFIFYNIADVAWYITDVLTLSIDSGNYWYSGTLSGTFVGSGDNTGSPIVTINYPIASDVWLTKGSQYLLWASVVHLNNLHKGFVFRQEGNLPPPEKYRDDALQAFLDWDIYKFEQDQRRGLPR